MALVWLYMVVRPWSFRLGSFWSAGRLVIALALLVPWTVFWGAAGIHGGGAAVLEDDSGIPLADFDAGEWTVKFFGRYSGTIDLFIQSPLASDRGPAVGPATR